MGCGNHFRPPARWPVGGMSLLLAALFLGSCGDACPVPVTARRVTARTMLHEAASGLLWDGDGFLFLSTEQVLDQGIMATSFETTVPESVTPRTRTVARKFPISAVSGRVEEVGEVRGDRGGGCRRPRGLTRPADSPCSGCRRNG
jgi:hypothetical protein